MSKKVNLNALIPREDFEVVDTTAPSQPRQAVTIRDLEHDSFFLPVLRKPDFQRETSEWSPRKICDFIESFLIGDLIPAVILWQSGSLIFVIDGAHRLSALLAWVHDDYGDGTISHRFYDRWIPQELRDAADSTRRMVKRRIGSYIDLRTAIQNPASADPKTLEKAQRLASLAVQLQWVSGDSKKAEQSFLKINQEAAPIDKTELQIIQARKSPQAIASRAISSSGKGHQYWSRFSTETKVEIVSCANEINELLFLPPLKTPVKTLDLPVGGYGASSDSLRLIFDLVSLASGSMPSSGTAEIARARETMDDTDGTNTVSCLKRTLRTVRRLAGTHASSLGLHPAVYFYSASGRYQPTAFLAVVSLFLEFDTEDSWASFTKIRSGFEQFLLSHKSMSNQITVKYGSGIKGFNSLKDAYRQIIEGVENNDSSDAIKYRLRNHSRLAFLNFDQETDSEFGVDFSDGAKSAAFLRAALAIPLRCAICNGLIHQGAITIDHHVRKRDGGNGNPENAQLAHPYCNSTYKN